MGMLFLTPRADARPEVTSFGDLHFLISFHPEDLRLGTATIEMLYTTTLGGIFAVDLDAGAPNPGWPIQVTESIVGSPVIGSLTNRGKARSPGPGSGWHASSLAVGRGLDGARGWGGSHWAQPPSARPATSTRIVFHSGVKQEARLRIFGVSGRLVRTLVDGPVEPGVHEATWDGLDGDGRPVSSGVYFYELELGRSRSSRKMLLLR